MSGRQVPKASSSRFSCLTDFSKSEKDSRPSWSWSCEWKHWTCSRCQLLFLLLILYTGLVFVFLIAIITCLDFVDAEEFTLTGRVVRTISPSSSLCSPPALWSLHQGPRLWAVWSDCPSTYESSPPGRYSCHHSGHTHESSLSHAGRDWILAESNTTTLYCICMQDLHFILSSKVPRRKTDSPSIHSFKLTYPSLSLSNVLKTGTQIIIIYTEYNCIKSTLTSNYKD